MRDTFNMATQNIYKKLTPLVDFFSKAIGFIFSIAPIVICSLLFLVWHILSLLTCFILPYSFNFQTTKEYISASSQNIVNGLTSFFENWLFSYFFYGVALLLTVPYLLAIGIYKLTQQLITLSKKHATIDNNVKQNKVNPSRSGELNRDKPRRPKILLDQKKNKDKSVRRVPQVDPTQNQKKDTGQKGKSIKKPHKLLDLIQINKHSTRVSVKKAMNALTDKFETFKGMYPYFEDDCKRSILDACNSETSELSEQHLQIPKAAFLSEFKRQPAVDREKDQKAPTTDLFFLKSLLGRINAANRVAIHQSAVDSKLGYSYPQIDPLYRVSSTIMTIVYLREQYKSGQLELGAASAAPDAIDLAYSHLDSLEQILSDKEYVTKIFKLLYNELQALHNLVNSGHVHNISKIKEGGETWIACSEKKAIKYHEKISKTLEWLKPNLSYLKRLSESPEIVSLNHQDLIFYLVVLLSIDQIKDVLKSFISVRIATIMEDTSSVDSQSEAGSDTPSVQPPIRPGMASYEAAEEKEVGQNETRSSFFNFLG
ncbi:MAG: hypothetical protein VX737_04235 [Pseudomonadota bacterium]|nr:hypothetical protein [Pseudomonadota bacterium]